MRNLLVLLFITAFQVFAGDSYAQNTKLSLKLSDVSVESLLNTIESQSEFHFLCNKGLVDLERKVSVNAENRSITEILFEIFNGTEVDYIILDRQIVISPSIYLKQVKNSLQIPHQERTVSGTVTDSEGQPLIGVTVNVKGTSIGAITNFKGNYEIKVSEDAKTLVFSYIGMKTQEVEISDKVTINITMLPDVFGIDEVVAVGYGYMKKSDITGSVGSMGINELSRSYNMTTSGLMQGNIAGIDINKNTNKPGGGYNIIIRGVSNFRSDNTPLFVVDGIAVDNIDNINPNDIEKIDVLKDASSAAIWGSRGGNGVVMITTGRGTEGKTTIEYNGYTGMKKAYNFPDLMNTEQFVQFALDAQTGAGNPDPQLEDVFTEEEIQWINDGVYINWPKLITRNALVNNHNIKVSGGENGHTYYYSTGFTVDEGVSIGEDYQRLNFRSSNDKQINDFLKVGLRNNMAYTLFNFGSGEAFRSAYRLRPVGQLYNEDGGYEFWPSPTESQIPNPLFDVENEIRETSRLHYYGSVYLQIKPTDWLSFNSTFSPDINFERYGEYRGKYTKSAVGIQEQTRASYQASKFWRYQWNNQLDINKDFKDHSLNATLVTSMYEHSEDGINTTIINFPTDHYSFYNLGAGLDITNLSSYYRKESLVSFIGRVSYSYKHRYLLTLNQRYDGSSRLAPGHKWASFPSAAFAWRISEEDFMDNKNLISYLKARLSYGKTGTAAVSMYQSQVNMQNTFYDFGGSGVPGIRVGGLANERLSWEIVNELNLGFDFGIFRNRIGGSLELYSRISQDNLQRRNIPRITGYSHIWDNIGTIRNRGIELSLNTINIKRGNFEWITNLQFTKNQNEIVDIDGTKEDNPSNDWFIGEDITTFWRYQADGIWQLDEAEKAARYNQDPGEVKVVDVDNNYQIDQKDRMFIGTASPDFYGSMTHTLKYRKFDLSFLIYTRQGFMVYSHFHDKFAWDQAGRFNGLMTDYWTPDNPTNNYFQPGNAGPYASSIRFMNISFWKVNYINLGYTFNANKLKFMNAQQLYIYLSAQNPFVLTDYEGWDPETAFDDTWGIAFMNRSLLFGLKVKF